MGWNNIITAQEKYTLKIKNEDQSKFYMLTQLRFTERSQNLTIYNKKIFVSGLKNNRLKRTKKKQQDKCEKRTLLKSEIVGRVTACTGAINQS